MTALDKALEGIRHGAYFYLPISSAPSDVALAVGKALRSHQAESTIEAYEHSVFEELVGASPAMKRVLELIQKVSPTDSTVLLIGESGTGKEVVANTVHRLSRRKDKPFIAINCAALPEALLESEMFGHVKGAFTGADRDKPGLFEEADGGTIFLDEIGDMALLTQAKLLRVLQNGEIRRVGAGNTLKVDVRVIAATNKNLSDEVAAHKFREDLYFRLNVVQVRIPPLRERMDALPSLISHFLFMYNEQFDKNIESIDDHAMGLLRNYAFPGNVRELESTIAHAVIMADGPVIRVRDLPEQIHSETGGRLALGFSASDDILSLEKVEEQHIRTTLSKLEGNQTQAAKKLGISRSTLWRKMQTYGIES
jgi:transcriptional regulator with PAS, ATPase and Fis domain